MLKRILLTFTLLLLALPFIGAQRTHAATTDAEIVLHKRIFPVKTNDGSLTSNDGLLRDPSAALLTQTEGINDVHFEVYDATALYQAALGKNQTAEEFVREYTALDLTAAGKIAADLQLVGDGNAGLGKVVTKTDNALSEAGVGRITLPQRQNGHTAAYYIIEVHNANDEVQVNMATAAPMMMVMNVRHPQTDVLLDTIHLYPKNDAYARDPWFFKYGVTLKDEKVRLQGVQYVMSKAVANGQRLYLGKYDGNQVYYNWYASTNPKTDKRLAIFTSDKNGLVATPELYLKGGSYQFNEIKTLKDYILDDTPIKVEVPARYFDDNGEYQYTYVNGEPIHESSTGILPDSIIKAGKPRVYNYMRKLPDTGLPPVIGDTPDPNPPVKTTKPSRPWLPQLGNGWSVFLIIAGLVLMAWVSIWWRLRSKRIDDFK